MLYRDLGHTGEKVSAICLGTMTWGEQNTREQAFQQMDYALEQGVNFFDVAEMYPIPPRSETQGLSEQYLGDWLTARGKRDAVFLASKVTGSTSTNFGLDHIRGGPRLTAEHVIEACEGSLRRLQTDYIDLYQIHWPERRTNFFGKLGFSGRAGGNPVPIEETLRAVGKLVEQGKVRYVGISNETPWGVMEYQRLAREFSLPAVVSIQNPYNLLNRSYEVGLSEISVREAIPLLAYSPLAFGTLSGKYLNGQWPEGARVTLFDRFTRYMKEPAEKATRQYVDLAREHGLDPAQMALAFVTSRAFVGSAIIGATTMEQLQSNIASVSLELSDEVLTSIEEIHLSHPNPAP